MLVGTFKGGIHPKGNKEATEGRSVMQAGLPSRVIVPMVQHTGAPCKPAVSTGDTVKKGQLLGRSDSFISSPVHASISGTVKAIELYPHPVAGRALSVVIDSDGRDVWPDTVRSRSSVAGLGKEELIEIIADSGIVGLGGAAFPTHVKLKSPKKIDTLILNGAECEPYLTCDYRLMIERPADILKGLGLMMKVLEAERTFIAIEDNKPDAIITMGRALKGHTGISIKVLPARYPQGSEKQLIEAVAGRRVPPKGLPLDVGCVVQNVGTALAVCEAVYYGRPLIERCITMAGACLEKPSNINARIGTAVKDLIDECGGLKAEPAKVIMGGPMMGVAQWTLDVPVIKGTTGLLFLSGEEARAYEEGACIRCGRCVEVCPMELLPLSYPKFVKGLRLDSLEKSNISDCMECGLCTYICPSRIPIVQYIRSGKRELLKRRR